MDLAQQISNLSFRLDQPRQRVKFTESTLTRLKLRIEQINADKALFLKALAVIDKAIGIISANGIGRIEATVSAGMQMVFENKNVGLTVEKKETKTGSKFELVPYKDTADGRVAGPAMETFGGGVVNVIAFLLRMIMIKRFKRAKLLVLDETFNNVAEKYLPKVSLLLKKLALEQGYNIILITHQQTLADAADRVYQVSGMPGEPPTIELVRG